MLGDAARLRFKRMDFGNLEVSELPPPRRLFRLSDLGVQIPDIGVHFPDMGVQIETIEVFRFERDAQLLDRDMDQRSDKHWSDTISMPVRDDLPQIAARPHIAEWLPAALLQGTAPTGPIPSRKTSACQHS